MKRWTLFIILFLIGSCVISAQTQKALMMYSEATSGLLQVKDFLKRDFSEVDSTSMHDLAVLFYRDKDYKSAATCWEIALGKVKKHGKAYEQIINNLSLIYTQSEDLAKLEWLLGIVEEHNKHELQKDCNDYKCKLERAQYFFVHGDEAKGKELIGESLKMCKTEEQLIEVEEAFAKILFDLADFEGAAQYHYSVANRWKTKNNQEKYGDALYSSALNYFLASKFSVAELYSREAVSVLETQDSPNARVNYIRSLSCWGDALYCQQKNAEALEVYSRELDECMRLFPKTEKYADALEDVGKAEVRLKFFDEAKEHLQEACDLYQLLKLDSKYSTTYSELLICMRKAGDEEEADQMEDESDKKRKQVYQRLLDEELPNLALTEQFMGSRVYTNSLHTIASCYMGLDQFEDAVKYFALYTDNLRKMLREHFLYQTEIDRKRIWDEQHRHIDAYRHGVAALPDSASALLPMFIPTLYDMELVSKGILLNSSIEFERVLQNKADSKLLETYLQIKRNQEQIDELQLVVSEENITKVMVLKQANSSLERQLMSDCASYRDYTRFLSYSWRDVQKNLDEKDVAIEFTTLPLSPLDQHNYILALILTSTDAPVMEVISTKAILKDLEAKEDLYDNGSYYKYIWGFLQQHLQGKERVFFAPDNNLSNVAIEYLNDGEKPFFEKYEVYRLSSTKELCRTYSETTQHKSISIFGDIDYDTELVSETKSGLAFGHLIYSKDEVKGIGNTMRRSYDVVLYDGKKATEKQFRQLSGDSPMIIHISSHGDYIGDDNTDGEDAMDCSLLALSGANKGSDNYMDDGIITASDVSKMNLHKCDLAVLSACKTGLGGAGTDGIFGLQRGFKNAGVHSLLMSLKTVYDESTSKLMCEFYKGIASGKSKRQALLDAQKALKEQGYKDGKYWAPFILLDGLN